MSELDKSHTVRLDAETASRVEALKPRFALPGRGAKTADVLRALIITGLTVEEAKVPVSKKESKR